jgi:hypothetical protein
MAARSSEPEETRCDRRMDNPWGDECRVRYVDQVMDHCGLAITPLLVRLLLPETGPSCSEASCFLLLEELPLDRGQSSKGLRFLTLAALRATGDAGTSSVSSATESSPAALNAMSAVRFGRLVEGGVAR